MIRLAALLIFLATSAQASDPDDLDIRASQEGHFAEIVYDNAAAMTSRSGTHVLTWEGEDFVVNIQLGGQAVGHAEIITVTPPDHLIAVPDYAEVPDGDVFTIQIMQPMF